MSEIADEGPAYEPRSVRSEVGGYFAMLAFLAAYCLNVMGTAHFVQTGLNLAGAGVAAVYLHKKRAVPSVISNLAWGIITLVGLIVR